MKFYVIIAMFMELAAFGQLPSFPTDPIHPGSQTYSCAYKKIESNQSTLYLPQALNKPTSVTYPIVVFGHGQAIKLQGYEKTFEHLAKKCIAVIYPQYDSHFFDQNFRKMAAQYNKIIHSFIKQYSILNKNKIIYSGHSKGAYVALVAAGESQSLANELILFQPAGYDSEWINNIPNHVIATIITSDADKIIKEQIILDIYKNLKVNTKQLIITSSYPELAADHFFILTKASIFGGQNSITPLHYYGAWKWLAAAALNLQEFIYGEQSSSTGDSKIHHKVIRNFN